MERIDFVINDTSIDDINYNEIEDSRAARLTYKVFVFEQNAGKWYTLFGRIILPFILFFLPINVICGRLNMLIKSVFNLGFNPKGPALFIMWAIGSLVFLALTIFLPKLATVAEFAIGITYLFIAFRVYLFKSFLGYLVAIGLILFLLVKLVFLVFEIIRKRAFKNDGKNIERDESGRVIRTVEDNVVFADEDSGDNPDGVSPVEDEFYFIREDKNDTPDRVTSSDDEVYFVKDNKEPDDNELMVSETDNDFFFG